jgi:hypothetical protein
MNENKGHIGKSSFRYNPDNASLKGSKPTDLLMCDHELNKQILTGYFIIAESTTPDKHDNLGGIKISEGQAMVEIPEECVRRMFDHYESIQRRRHQLAMELEQERIMQNARYSPSHPNRHFQ